MKCFFLFSFFFLIGTSLLSQSDFSSGDENIGHHHHALHEIGIANSPVYFIKEKEISYGLHLHYIYNLKHSKFGVGVGYERIFDDHKHTTWGIVGTYRPIDEWSINLSPGITYENLQTEQLAFSIHIETSYEFEFNGLHIGPALEFAYDPEDIHISLGVHMGFAF